MPKKLVIAARSLQEPGRKVAAAILDFIGEVPSSGERKGADPSTRAREIASATATKAALTAGSLALPPGPLGLITILPEMIAVWKLQAQMVADIGASYGKEAYLSREQMLYCLFRHTAAQAMRDVVVRVGERVLVQRASLGVLQGVANKIGIKVTQRAIGKGMARWLPLVGALGVGAYAYFDTGQVARTTIDLFEREIEIEPA